MGKINIHLKFFVKIICRSVTSIYQMQFYDLNYFLNNFFGSAFGCWAKNGVIKKLPVPVVNSNDQIKVDFTYVPTGI